VQQHARSYGSFFGFSNGSFITDNSSFVLSSGIVRDEQSFRFFVPDNDMLSRRPVVDSRASCSIVSFVKPRTDRELRGHTIDIKYTLYVQAYIYIYIYIK